MTAIYDVLAKGQLAGAVRISMARFSLIFSGVWSLLVVAWVAGNFAYYRYLRLLMGVRSELPSAERSRFLQLETFHDVGGWDTVFDVDLNLGQIVGTVFFPVFTCLVLAAIFDRIGGRMSWRRSDGTPSLTSLHFKFSLVFGVMWTLAACSWAAYKFYHLQSFIGVRRKIFDSDESRFVELLTHDVRGFHEVYAVNLLPLEIASTVIIPLVVCLALGAAADRLSAWKSRYGKAQD